MTQSPVLIELSLADAIPIISTSAELPEHAALGDIASPNCQGLRQTFGADPGALQRNLQRSRSTP
jgi:hypothetical protein